jgi:flagellar assembly protein FliH
MGNEKHVHAGGGEDAGSALEVFEYPLCEGEQPVPAWNGWAETTDAAAEAEGTAEIGDTQSENRRLRDARGNTGGGTNNERTAEQLRRSYEEGREQGRQEGRAAEGEVQKAALKTEQERYKRQLAELVKRFADESEKYLHSVERETVKLALAVAGRILRREAQMDPLLLTGAVRVALGQLAAASEVQLRVPAADVDLWKETIGLIPNLAVRPTVISGEGMRVGECVIESKVESVDLGVRAQLGEIERGFFDRGGSSGESRKGSDTQESGARMVAAGGELRS